VQNGKEQEVRRSQLRKQAIVGGEATTADELVRVAGLMELSVSDILIRQDAADNDVPHPRQHAIRTSVEMAVTRSLFIRPTSEPMPCRLRRHSRRCATATVVLVTAFWTLLALAHNPSAGDTSEFASARDDVLGSTGRNWTLSSVGHASVGQEDAAAQVPGYRWRGPIATQPDRAGLGRDTGFFLGYQFAVVAALYVAPEDISGWSKEQKQSYGGARWRENVSNPIWDADRWWINYILHPYWGGAYYIRGRERGLSRIQSFWYSALLSTLYEFGAEALFEPVSIQDVFVTPIVGSLVGEYLFAPWRDSIRAKVGALDWSDKAVLFLTDPLGVVNAQVEHWLGVRTTLTLQPIGARLPEAGPGAVLVGFPAEMSRPLRNPAPAWGLQLRITW
jgi:hypothetical protein